MPERPLNTWKEIADHLGVSVRTAQRYHGDGMPVHKPERRKRGAKRSVFAFPSELEIWIRGKTSSLGEIQTGAFHRLLRKALSPAQRVFGPHAVYVLTWSLCYSLFFGTALALELVYDLSSYQSLILVGAPLSALGIFIATALTFRRLEFLIARDSRRALPFAALALVSAALVNYLVFSFWMPRHPIVAAEFQTYAASAAYLKTLLYGLFVGLVFMVPPFVLVRSLERLIGRGESARVAGLLSGDRTAIAPKGAVFFRPFDLAVVFAFSLAGALLMMTHLLDNLVHNEFAWLFQKLLWIRMALFLAAGLATLWWLWTNLNDLKRQAHSALSSDPARTGAHWSDGSGQTRQTKNFTRSVCKF